VAIDALHHHFQRNVTKAAATRKGGKEGEGGREGGRAEDEQRTERIQGWTGRGKQER